MAAISEIGDFRTRSALFVICSAILGLSTHSFIRESQGRNELHVCQTWRMKANDEEANVTYTRKDKEQYKSASKSGMFFHFAVKFKLFKEFCSIHKTDVVIFNLIPFDLSFVYRCARFIKKVHWGILICSSIVSLTVILCFY